MFELSMVALTIIVMIALLWYYNPAPVKNKTCHNCRFLSTGTCVNEQVVQAVLNSGGTIEDAEITNPEPCSLWDWNGE